MRCRKRLFKMPSQLPKQPAISIGIGITWLVLVLFFSTLAWSWWSHGIVYDLGRTDLDAPVKIHRIRTFFASCGPVAPLAYFAMVTTEVVVAPIPGLMLYAPGGAIFGPLVGGALSLAGNVVGAGIACLLARNLRPRWMDELLSSEKARNLQARLEQHGGWYVFFLRINPLTSSDVVSYAAGFTRIPLTKVMLATFAGMAPLCFAQAYLAVSLLDAFPKLIYFLTAALALYLVIAILVIRRLMLDSRADAAIAAVDS
jgi:uncharacterized membrane protein YdjX (TVP38/TMEM64 family)